MFGKLRKFGKTQQIGKTVATGLEKGSFPSNPSPTPLPKKGPIFKIVFLGFSLQIQ